MRRLIVLALIIGALSGCAVFRPPATSVKGPTVPTGEYDNAAEKWADESLSARRKIEKEKTEKELQRTDQK